MGSSLKHTFVLYADYSSMTKSAKKHSRNARNQDLSIRELSDFYRALLKPRLFEERMLTLLRQGRISKWFSGIGQEAISVGATLALEKDEFILPLHRNLGVFTTRHVPLERLFAQFQGKPAGFTKGRDRSFHFGIPEYNIVGMISHLGAQLGVADGIALAHSLRKQNKVTLVFSGDGGTSEGDFHEALNLASVWDLPVIFLIENNGYGLSTPVSEQYRCEKLSNRAAGYGIEGITIDGNQLLEVYKTISDLASDIRQNPRPVLVECMTFRMRGHEEASGVKYVPRELFDQWEKKDPVRLFENDLLEAGVLTLPQIEQIKIEMAAEVADIVEGCFDLPEVTADPSVELDDVFAPVESEPPQILNAETSELRFVDAISAGLRQAMQRYPEMVIMGQDIAEYGGVFKITEGFLEEFGRERVRNTPICESAVIGAALGLSIAGVKSVVEMQFADFVSCGFNQIINNLAKVHYRWHQSADVVIRMPTGAGVNAGPFHSQSTEAWFVHTPGLKVVYPSTPYDAKGLLLASLADPNPVMFFEHKALYRSLKGQVPDDYYTLPIGKANLIQEGEDAVLVSYGAAVHWCQEVLNKHPEVSASLIDLRTLAPLDFELILTEVEKTSRVLIVHEANLTAGIGAEVAAQISERCFGLLDAPVMRVAGLDTPVPFASKLEEQYLPRSRIEGALFELLNY